MLMINTALKPYSFVSRTEHFDAVAEGLYQGGRPVHADALSSWPGMDVHAQVPGLREECLRVAP